jgi:hypothetical protein
MAPSIETPGKQAREIYGLCLTISVLRIESARLPTATGAESQVNSATSATLKLPRQMQAGNGIQRDASALLIHFQKGERHGRQITGRS